MAGRPEHLEGRKRALAAVLFCVTCTAVNYIGSQLASATGLPLFFDSFGTILAGIFGGYVPGVLVGYTTNLLTSASDPVSVYYCLSNVLVAVFAAFFANRNYFDHLHTAALAILTFSFIGGVIGSGITWVLNGMPDTVVSASGEIFVATLGTSGYISQLCGDFFCDIVDKTVMVACALATVKLLPQGLKNMFDFTIWKQKPLEGEQLAHARHVRTRRISLRAKIAAFVGVIMITIVAVTCTVSSIMFFQSNAETQTALAEGIASLMVDEIDANRVDAYLEEGERAEGYSETEARLQSIKENFPELEYAYVYKIEEDGCHVVFDLDTEELEGSSPGEVMEFDEAFVPFLPELLAGKAIEPIASNDSFGWLLTVYTPLYDDTGQCTCYLGLDVSMQRLVDDGIGFMLRVIILFLAFFIVICTVAIWLAEYRIIMPVNSIAYASSSFAFDSASSRDDSVKALEELEISTGDEIENLYLAVTKTSEDTVKFIAESNEQAQTIARMQENLIMVMADLVESRDAFTGDHVRKTAEYARITMEQMRRDGFYSNELTDEFIDDVVKSAPLHDIGKITVSDTILNKPGRLTDEEFEIMKNHTTAGYEILENAKVATSEASYLDEAQHLALGHHEKWNGQGYPQGLAERDIPLSARIMAVADVFDALVSKRSYKDAMPLEKAFGLIEEGAGTHFDPLVTQSFLNAEEEVRKVAESHGDGGTAKDIRSE